MSNKVTIYPKIYKGLFNALTMPCPLNVFNDTVQGYYADMARIGLVNINEGVVSRSNRLPADFMRAWPDGSYPYDEEASTKSWDDQREGIAKSWGDSRQRDRAGV